MFKKNTAAVGFGIGHFINASTGAAVTTGTPTCKRTLDGTGGSCANAASYNSDGAVWEIDLDAADMNADVVILSFALTDCVPIAYTIKTVTGVPDANGRFPADATAISGDSTAADNAESFFDGTGYAGTNNVIPTVTTLTNGVTLADDAITAAKFDESTAYPLKSPDTGATAVARTGADSDTLETLSDEIAALNDLSAAEVNAEVDAALADINLDHLMKTGDATLTNIVADNTALAHLMAIGADISDYDSSTDSLEGIAGAGGGGAPTVEQIRAEIDANSTQLAAIVTLINAVPTNEEFAAAFPTNFASLSINASGHVARVVLCDTTTTNTDMRGTDNAALAASALDSDDIDALKIYGDANWATATTLDAAGVRAALGVAAADLDSQLDAILAAGGGGGGDATEAKQDTIIANLATVDALLDKFAPILIGTVTNSRTGTEVFVYDGVTVTSVNDSDGNRSSVTFT